MGALMLLLANPSEACWKVEVLRPQNRSFPPLQALRTRFVKTEEAVVQWVVPLDASTEVLHIRNIASDAGEHISFSAGRCQVAEGAHASCIC